MSRRSVVWLLTLPLAVVGSQVAHALAYRLATANDSQRAHELTASGHGYLAYAPVALAVCATLVVLALARELGGVLAGDARPPARPSALSFALLAPAIFVGQEHFERLVHEGVFPSTLVFEKTFVLGILLQLPTAILAYGVARILLGATRAVGARLAVPRIVYLRTRSTWPVGDLDAPRSTPSGLTRCPRGPPVLLVA